MCGLYLYRRKSKSQEKDTNLKALILTKIYKKRKLFKKGVEVSIKKI